MHPSVWTPCETWSKTWTKATFSYCASGAASKPNSGVKKEIGIGLALAALDGSDAQARLAAISTLRYSLRQDVLNKLEALLEKSPDGSFVESDEHVRAGRRDCGEVHQSAAHVLFRHPNSVFWTESRIRARADCHRTRDYVWRHGSHQHGARRVDDARRLHDLRCPGGDARTHRHLYPRGHSGGVSGCSADWRPDRAHHHPFSLRPAPGDPARHVWRQPHPAAAGSFDFYGAQPICRDARLDERHTAVERCALDHLQPSLYRDLHAACFRGASRRSEVHADRSRNQGRFAEPCHG